MSISTKEVPVKAHQSVGTVERYHAPLRRAYKIIRAELKGKEIDKHMMLQMAIKAVNDTVGPNGLVPTLLVIGSYPRLADLDPPSPTISQCAAIIKSAMQEVQRCYAARQVNDASRIRNDPDFFDLNTLPLDCEVLVWRENNKWTGPFRLLAIDSQSCSVEQPNGPPKFRSTIVKPYLRNQIEHTTLENIPIIAHSPTETNIIRSNPPREHRISVRYREGVFTTMLINSILIVTTFFSAKEKLDSELAIDLRSQRVITSGGKPFQESRIKEIEGLIQKGIFKFVPNDEVTRERRLFKSRFVDEIKGKGTPTHMKNLDWSSKLIMTKANMRS